MILTCPNCGTQYVVKDDAIPPQGRQVRCASCKHSWHQDPLSAPGPEATEDPETVAEATIIEPRSGPEAEERAYEGAMMEDEPEAVASAEPAEAPPEPAAEAEEGGELAAEQHAQEVSADFNTAAGTEAPAAMVADWNEPPQAEATDDEFSPFPAADEVQPRRRSPLLAILVVVFIVAVLAAAFYFYAPPEWKARVGLPSGTTTQLTLVTTHMERQQLASGNQLLTITGRVINPTASEQQVPPMQAQLRSRGGKVVYTWTIDPPARTLAPGASASFNSAEVNVPAGGEELTITLGELKT
jgi:predicted Zn finger-like uncharacterized protein